MLLVELMNGKTTVTNFQNKIYELLKKVPKGKVITYKELAKAAKTKAYRAVGTAMARNPFAPRVPCHRVVNSDGKIGNYSGKGRVKTKIKMLRKEGVEVKNNRIDLKKYLFRNF